jgi:hypothetical protein
MRRSRLLILTIAIGVVAGGAAAGVALATQQSSSPTTSITTTSTTQNPASTTNAVTAANQVAQCQRLHDMPYASTRTTNPSGVSSPFLAKNSNPYDRGDPIYEAASPTIILFQFCRWPPSPGADQTGYSQVLLTTVPGSSTWPGEVSDQAYADVVDTTCPTVAFVYTGGHTGSSVTTYARVSAMQLVDTEPAGGPVAGASPVPTDLSAWADSLAYYLQPGESAVFHPGYEQASSARCQG